MHVLFKCTGNTLQDRAYLGHEISLNKLKTEITSSIFSNHNVMTLEINHKKKAVKNTNTWRLNNMLLNNQWITEEIKKYLEKNENEIMMIKNLLNKSSSKKKVYSSTNLP